MSTNNFNIDGLTDRQVIISREKYGQNKLEYKKENKLLSTIKRIIKEPMLILLLIAALIYFISGKTNDGFFLVGAIIFQISISLFQYSRSKNALDKLKDFTQPKCKVIRNGKEQEIKSEGT